MTAASGTNTWIKGSGGNDCAEYPTPSPKIYFLSVILSVSISFDISAIWSSWRHRCSFQDKPSDQAYNKFSYLYNWNLELIRITSFAFYHVPILMSSEERRTQASTAAMDPAVALPLELWELILEGVSPSELTVLAQVSRTFTNVVRSLSVWRIIWNKAGLGSQNMATQQHDFYEAVLAFSSDICECCYCYCNGPFHTLLCDIRNPTLLRRYVQEREPQRAQKLLKASRFADTRNLCDHCNAIREQKRDQRRKYLEHHLKHTLGGKDYRTNVLPLQYLPYVLSGHRGDIQTTVEYISREPVHIGLEKALPPKIRKSKLECKLQERGLQLREDSRLCAKYIKRGDTIPVDEIVEVMVEMDWLHRKTRYGYFCIGQTNVRISTFSMSVKPTLSMKEKALKEYIQSRFENNQWSHVQNDPETPARPPRSLWNLIEKLTRRVYVEYAIHCITLGPSTSVDKLQTFTDEQLIQEMDEGAKVARKSSVSSPSLQLSEELKQFLGESSLHGLLTQCRAKRIIG
ncbi:hypothetical protein BJV82DRAFT_687789 [Fennellomyces sp. T-0311]|nr:hypothetical protein BJV82DRAFT_687789 [Fennellomyces sp. T-0311]